MGVLFGYEERYCEISAQIWAWSPSLLSLQSTYFRSQCNEAQYFSVQEAKNMILLLMSFLFYLNPALCDGTFLWNGSSKVNKFSVK